MLDGNNKSIDEQLIILDKILKNNSSLVKILKVLEKYSLENESFNNYYVAAGCINQTVFNYYHGYSYDFGIGDYDIVYFDDDLSYEAEDKIINDLNNILPRNCKYDIKNEARVHLWYKEKFGTTCHEYFSVEDAISCFGASVTCIGVRLCASKLKVFCPYGLSDLFSLTIRPIKKDFLKEQYDLKCIKWKKKWNKLNIIKW